MRDKKPLEEDLKELKEKYQEKVRFLELQDVKERYLKEGKICHPKKMDKTCPVMRLNKKSTQSRIQGALGKCLFEEYGSYRFAKLEDYALRNMKEDKCEYLEKYLEKIPDSEINLVLTDLFKKHRPTTKFLSHLNSKRINSRLLEEIATKRGMENFGYKGACYAIDMLTEKKDLDTLESIKNLHDFVIRNIDYSPIYTDNFGEPYDREKIITTNESRQRLGIIKYAEKKLRELE